MDEFILWAKEPKATRFGYEQLGHLVGRETATAEELQQISHYFNVHYFGPESQWKGQNGQRRVYLTFDKNSHIILHRLNQANDRLDNVIVAHFPFRDLVSNPLPEWKTYRLSYVAYDQFAKILLKLLDLERLK